MIDENLTNKRKSDMTDKERVRLFQRKLYSKAKQESDFRFYVLYDKMYIAYFLRESWQRVKSHGGAAGYDKVTISDIEDYGVGKYLNEIAEELKSETYKAQPILRVYIPKLDGKLRPLGIPCVKDRIAQTCCKLIIEPIFEADFEDCSYGFRPKRSAHDAVKAIRTNLKAGKREVYDADISGYFDNIPHDKLMFLVERRITDKRILRLIRQWLKAPIFEDNKLNKSKKGTPQGGIISPLLANIYLDLIDKAVMRKDGHFYKHGISIVRYADDFILMARKIAQPCLDYLKLMLDTMELTVNEEKTSLVKVTKQPFSYLGFDFRYNKSVYGTGTKHLHIVPTKKSEKSIRLKIVEYFRYNGHKDPASIVWDLNPVLRGWINYVTVKGTTYPRKARRNLQWYMVQKLNRFYYRKSQRKCKMYCQDAFGQLVSKYGLINPANYNYV